MEHEPVTAALEENFLKGEGKEVAEWKAGAFLMNSRDRVKSGRLRRERKTRLDEGRVEGWR